MVRDFEHLCRKPTGGRLESMVVDVAPFHTLQWDAPEVPAYKAGEWLVELICLIPIHIAVARENRFIPLKDGILSTEFDNQLLGAEISDIIDNITFGWYESVFRSYMAARPVKVVSSMGEFTMPELLDVLIREQSFCRRAKCRYVVYVFR